MIIGNRLIASAFIPFFPDDSDDSDDSDVIFFATGVSNSKETRKEEFLREKEMFISHSLKLRKQI
jgi:hypothetical protein